MGCSSAEGVGHIWHLCSLVEYPFSTPRHYCCAPLLHLNFSLTTLLPSLYLALLRGEHLVSTLLHARPVDETLKAAMRLRAHITTSYLFLCHNLIACTSRPMPVKWRDTDGILKLSHGLKSTGCRVCIAGQIP